MTVTTNEVLVEGFVRFLETAEDTDGVLDSDVFVDLNVPHWRYQLQGARALAEQLRQDSPNGSAITVGRRAATPTGFVVECAYRQDDHVGVGTVYRTMWLVEVANGRIAEVVLYCTGEWDAETQKRQAAEAPMIRG